MSKATKDFKLYKFTNFNDFLCCTFLVVFWYTGTNIIGEVYKTDKAFFGVRLREILLIFYGHILWPTYQL